MKRLKIVGIGGSLAETSASLAALQLALDGAREAGAETELFDVKAMGLPLYVPGTDDVPEEAQALVEASHAADGLVWSSPMYHGTVSGAFKNALDWLDLMGDYEPPFLTDKVIGLISTAGGVQGLQAVNTMEFIVRALRGYAVPLVIPIPHAWKTFNEAGQARDPDVEKQLHALGQEVVRAASQMASQGRCDYSNGQVASS